MRRIRCVVMAVAVALSSAAAAAGEVVRIKVNDVAFDPPEVSARVGDTIEWVNDDFIDHTATALGGQWDVALPTGASATTTVLRAESIGYVCRFHPQMKGVIRVREP